MLQAGREDGQISIHSDHTWHHVCTVNSFITGFQSCSCSIIPALGRASRDASGLNSDMCDDMDSDMSQHISLLLQGVEMMANGKKPDPSNIHLRGGIAG